MARQKVVNGVYYDLTAEEEAALEAQAEAGDLDLNQIRSQRNGTLAQSDVTQIGDFPLGVDSLADWQTYRQELRDYMAAQTRISTQTAWPKSPLITRIGQAAYDTEVAKDGSGPAEGETARTAAEGAAGYPAPGI